jgi:hypothetical protein
LVSVYHESAPLDLDNLHRDSHELFSLLFRHKRHDDGFDVHGWNTYCVGICPTIAQESGKLETGTFK